MAKRAKNRVKDSFNGGSNGQATALQDPTDGANDFVQMSEPYRIRTTIEGNTAILFHAWNVESVAEKAALAKGSKGKKVDDVKSYVYRVPKGSKGAGNIAIPGVYLMAALRDTAKFFQDPRSPRAGFGKLLSASMVVQTEFADTGSKTWDYLDKRRVTVQRNGVTRHRPALLKGWKATFEIEVLLPEYLPKDKLLQILSMCGRVNGIADFRPTFGRFQVTEFKQLK